MKVYIVKYLWGVAHVLRFFGKHHLGGHHLA